MKRIEIQLKTGGVTFRNIPDHWTLDYVHDFLENHYKGEWEDWTYV
jgi:hypothetical protein